MFRIYDIAAYVYETIVLLELCLKISAKLQQIAMPLLLQSTASNPQL